MYCFVCDRGSCRILSTVFVLGKSILTLLIVPHRTHKKSVIMKTSCLDYSILPKANGLKNFSVLKNVPRLTNNELFTPAKTFHRLYTAVDHDRINVTLTYDNKMYCTRLFNFDIQWNAPLLNWRNCFLMLLKNRFTLTYRLWHAESSSAVTLLLHTDWMMPKDASNQCGANFVAPSAGDADRLERCISRKLFGDSCRTETLS